MVDLGLAGSSFSTSQGYPVDYLETLSDDYLVDHLGGLQLWRQVQGGLLEPLDSGALGVGQPGTGLCASHPGGSPPETSPLHPGPGVPGGGSCPLLGLDPVVPGNEHKGVVLYHHLHLPDCLLGCWALCTSYFEHPALLS